MKQSVVIVDPHVAFRRWLEACLARQPGVTVVASSGTVDTAPALVRQHSPDLTFLDLGSRQAGQSRGLAVLRELKEDDPGRRVIALLGAEQTPDELAAIRAGADGHLACRATPAELKTRLTGILAGRTLIRNEVAASLADELRAEAAHVDRDLRMLSERERAVLGGLALGHSNRLIARDLQIDEPAVDAHVDHLLRRLSFRSRVEAAVWAAQQGVQRSAAAQPG